MTVKIRLSRKGSTHLPIYRVVVANSRAPRDGRFLEKVGNYNPLLPKDSKQRVNLNLDRINYWVSVGAQLTDTVKRLLNNLLNAQKLKAGS